MNSQDSLATGARLADIRARIERRLAELAPAGPPAESFSRVVRYSLLAPGKRLRPTLTVLAAESLGGAGGAALDVGCAIEMIHTASLIVDDLPSMDNARWRRGQLSCHAAFGEDKAILAGFALVNQAFDVISRADGLAPDVRLDLVQVATRAIGLTGIIAGQDRDLDAEHGGAAGASADAVTQTYDLKTGALFVAAAEAGARIAGVTGANLAPIREFARHLGLAYQTRDDLIDRQLSREEAGKDTGIDTDKITLISLVGERRAIALNHEVVNAAVDALRPYGDAAKPLADLSRMLFEDSDRNAGGVESRH